MTAEESTAIDAFAASLTAKTAGDHATVANLLAVPGVKDAIIDAAKAYYSEALEQDALWKTWLLEQGFPSDEEADRRGALTQAERDKEDEAAFAIWREERRS